MDNECVITKRTHNLLLWLVRPEITICICLCLCWCLFESTDYTFDNGEHINLIFCYISDEHWKTMEGVS
jgi:hypothetical protein